MATKNYAQMTTKKLNALLNTASDEDKALIEQELAAREAIKAEPIANTPTGGVDSNDVVESELTAEEEAQVAAAEANGGKLPKAPRMTEEERAALIEELKTTCVGHKCQVLPMGKAEWAEGVITGIMNDKRANNVMLNIKLADGRIVRKMHNAETLKVLDETVELVRAVGSGRKAGPKDDTPWDTMEAEITAAAEHVGKCVNVITAEGSEPVSGRITSIVPDKRVKSLLYKIVVPGEAEGTVKTIHKVVGSKALIVAEDFDEAGQKMHDDFVARREKIAAKEPQTLEQKIAQAEIDLKKAEERVAMAQAKLEAQKAYLEKLQAEATATVAAAEEAEQTEELA